MQKYNKGVPHRDICLFLFGKSVTAEGFSFALGTSSALPDTVEMVGVGIHQRRFVGEDAGLEAARTIAFHSNACASKDGAANIGHLAIEDQNLEMHPRTKHPFQAIKQGRVFVEVFTKSGTWLLGMNEPHINALIDEFCQNRKEGLRL